MELDEWEFLPSDGLFELNQHVPNSKIVVDMNYFQKFIEPQHKKNKNTREIPVVPFQFDPKTEEIPLHVKEIPEDQSSKEQIEDPKPVGISETCDQETISQVFFKKLKENEFVDMKIDTPKSVNRGIIPQSDLGSCQFEKKDDNFEEKSIKVEKSSNLKEEEMNCDDNISGFNIWKWTMTGIGAVVCFGIAVTTVSLIVLGNHQKEQHNQNTKLHYQIYPHEKRINQVVHHAKKLNEAIRGAPLTRAHITLGGYYEGL